MNFFSLKLPKLIFYFLLFLLVISKVLTLIYYGFEYTGTDDLIYWHMAKDYSEGVFHEPYFYGQAYNFPIEAYFAIPLLKLGLQPHLALPISTTFLAIVPFLFFSFILLRKKQILTSYLLLAIPICMPIEYDIITSMSRGFVNGIFFSSFLIIPLLYPKKYSSFLMLGLSISFGFIANPNSVIICFPIGLYLLLMNISTWRFYLFTLLSMLPAILFLYLAQQFYIENPDYISHKMWVLYFSFEELVTRLGQLDSFFTYLTPIYWKGHWMILLVPFFIGIYLMKNNWRKGVSLISSVLLVLFSLGVNKVGDQVDSIFFSSTRMYLALPLLAGLGFIWSSNQGLFSKRIGLGILSICVVFVTMKIFTIETTVEKHTANNYFGPVSIIKVDELKTKTISLQKQLKDKEVDLIIFVPSPNYAPSEMALLTYGAPFMVDDFPTTNLMNYERRSWNFIEEKNTSKKNVVIFNLILGYNPNLSGMSTEILQHSPDIMLIKDNYKTALELSQIFQFPYLRN